MSVLGPLSPEGKVPLLNCFDNLDLIKYCRCNFNLSVIYPFDDDKRDFKACIDDNACISLGLLVDVSSF